MEQQITLRSLETPRESRPQDDLLWFCESFGFCSGRDLDQMATRIVQELVEHYAEETRVSSELLAQELEISPARVNHHIRNLAESGFVYRKNRLIFIRGGSLKSAVDEIRKDANRILDNIEMIAEEVDRRLGLRNRQQSF